MLGQLLVILEWLSADFNTKVSVHIEQVGCIFTPPGNSKLPFTSTIQVNFT